MPEPKKGAPAWAQGEEKPAPPEVPTPVVEPVVREKPKRTPPPEITFPEPELPADLPLPDPPQRGVFETVVDKLFGPPRPKLSLSERGLTAAGFTYFVVRAHGRNVKYLRCPCGKTFEIKE